MKSDIELGASEALGGNDHDALGTGSTLSGIEFTIANASDHGVMVGGEWFRAGDEVMTIETAWDEEAGAYAAQTAPDALPYGTYTIQETATNDSYLLTDGEPRTFEVREDGAVVTADAEGGALEFRDQVVRNDLKLSKKADDTNESLQVPFAITNAATGETHVLVTDRNGQASTEAGWNKHTESTNGNDRLLEAETITSDMMDPEAGIWFGLGEDGSAAPAADELGALPFGEYTRDTSSSPRPSGWSATQASPRRSGWLSTTRRARRSAQRPPTPPTATRSPRQPRRPRSSTPSTTRTSSSAAPTPSRAPSW